MNVIEKGVKKILIIVIVIFSFNNSLYNKRDNIISNYYCDKYVKNNYHLFLEIPSINFSNDILFSSTLNNGLEIMKGSILPNQKNSMVIIMGHSGIGNNALFNDLVKLNVGDKIFLTYLNEKYEYIIYNIDYIDKYKNYVVNNDNQLYLVTCDLKNLHKQIVINSKKIDFFEFFSKIKKEI